MKKIISLRNIVGSFFLLATVFLLAGCSMSKNASPSREEVAKMIAEKRSSEYFYIDHDFNSKAEDKNYYSLCDEYSAMREGDYPALLSYLVAFWVEGLVEIHEDKSDEKCNLFTYTDKGKPYLSDKGLLMAEFGTVAISEMTVPTEGSSMKTITVNYKLVPKMTPFGEAAFPTPDDLLKQEGFSLESNKGGYENIPYKNGKGKATLVLYDDGWKVESVDHLGGGF
jgi:hypothetical protein